jgi:hypothetical protein
MPPKIAEPVELAALPESYSGPDEGISEKMTSAFAVTVLKQMKNAVMSNNK